MTRTDGHHYMGAGWARFAEFTAGCGVQQQELIACAIAAPVAGTASSCRVWVPDSCTDALEARVLATPATAVASVGSRTTAPAPHHSCSSRQLAAASQAAADAPTWMIRFQALHHLPILRDVACGAPEEGLCAAINIFASHWHWWCWNALTFLARPGAGGRRNGGASLDTLNRAAYTCT